jgi:hypothetical protein
MLINNCQIFLSFWNKIVKHGNQIWRIDNICFGLIQNMIFVVKILKLIKMWPLKHNYMYRNMFHINW